MTALFFIFHVVFASTIAGVIAAICGSLSPWISWLAILTGAWIAFRCARAFSQDAVGEFQFARFSDGGRGLIELILVCFIGYVAVRHYMWLWFPLDHSWATLSGFNYGDLPLHINYIRNLALGGHFPPVDPIFAAEPLRYPFGLDFYSALWESIGVPLRSHLFLAGTVATVSSLVFLRLYAGWWGMLAFFLSGGWLGWSTFAGQPLTGISEGIEWKNLFLAVFLTQRGYLFALPAGLFLLTMFEKHLSGERSLQGRRGVAFGIVWGVFPWFHLHVFLIVSVMMAILAFVRLRDLKAATTALFRTRFFAVAVIPATLLILRSTDFFRKASIAHLSWGWTFESDKQNLWDYLNFNFGPWLWLPLVTAVALISNRPHLNPERRRQLALELVGAAGLFLIFFNLMLAPWPWDNIKILIWPYLWLVRVAYLVFEEALGDWSRSLLALVMGLSGFMMLAWSVQAPSVRGLKVFDLGDTANVQGSIVSVPIDAVFAAAPIHDHPLAYLGRVRALGYLGHLWSHGIDSASTEKKQTALMTGDPDWLRLAHELKVTYIYWGPWERTRYGAGDRIWMHLLENVSHVPGFEVYAVPLDGTVPTVGNGAGASPSLSAGAPAPAATSPSGAAQPTSATPEAARTPKEK